MGFRGLWSKPRRLLVGRQEPSSVEVNTGKAWTLVEEGRLGRANGAPEKGKNRICLGQDQVLSG